MEKKGKKEGKSGQVQLDRKSIPLPERLLETASRLMPGKTENEVARQVKKTLAGRMLPAILLSFILLAAAFFGNRVGQEKEITTVLRPEAWEKSRIQKIEVQEEEEWKTIELEIFPWEYTQEQIRLLQEKAERILDDIVFSENTGQKRIEQNLIFPETVLETCQVEWSTDHPGIITAEGVVNNKELQEETAVTIMAKIFYGEEFRRYERQVTVVPKTYSSKELSDMQIQEELERIEEEGRTEKEISFPTALFGKKIRLQTDKNNGYGFLALVAVFLPLAVYRGFTEELEKKRKRREQQAEKAYAEFVTKLSLLMAAGLTARKAFLRLQREYQKRYGETCVLAQELHITCQELANGRAEPAAYEAFGERMGGTAYKRTASLLAQNVTKGIQDMRRQMLAEAKEVMEEERAGIKIRGEEAGSRLVFPMMGYLILIFAILLVPAFRMF